MKAVITGGSSGIGKEIAKLLSQKGYQTVIVGRNATELKYVSDSLPSPSAVEEYDLSIVENAFELFEKHKDADVIVNCAGVGVFGEFDRTDIHDELSMINVNVITLHVLTKLFYSEFVKRRSGMILNVSSSASYFVGPAYSSYYASKAYVSRLTSALAYESKKNGYGVGVTLFCPGPVKTDFGKKYGIKDGKGAISSSVAAKKAVEGMLNGKTVVFPNLYTRMLVVLSRLLPESILSNIVYKQQLKKLTDRSADLINNNNGR